MFGGRYFTQKMKGDAPFPGMDQPFEGYGESIRMVDWPDTYRIPDGVDEDALADHYADQVQAADVTIEVNADAGPVQARGDLLDMC